MERAEKYAAAALASACTAISSALKGQRNETINTESFGIGQLVAAGAMPFSEARDALMSAALSNGVDKHEAEASIKSGLQAGMKNARNLPEASAMPPVKLAAKQSTADYAKQLYREAVPMLGTLAERYLRQHRGITGDLPSGIRFHPGVWHKGAGQKFPVMIAPIIRTDATTTRITAAHITFLNPETGAKTKADPAKKMYGTCRGGAIWLGDYATHMLCAEGIEKGLACQAATGIPAAVGLSSTLLPSIVWPRGTTRVTLCADPNGAGETAIHKAAQALGVDGITLYVCYPPVAGKDWDEIAPAEVRTAIAAAKPWGASGVAKPDAIDTSISQDSVASAFADKHEAFLRYCHSTGSWFRWTGTHWRQDAERLAFNFVRELARESTMFNTPGEQRSARSAQFASGVERFAQADPRLSATSEFWDCDPWLLGTPDGTVDLRTGLLRPALSAEGITRLTAVAPAARDDCPVWKQFLWEATDGDECLIRFLQQWVGYSLTGDIREQSLVFAHGDGGNGKGTFINTISAIFGAYAVTAAMDTFTASKYAKHSTDLAMLKGARMVNASETEEGHAWAEGRIKNITGGDPITARFMRRDNFTYMPQFKLFIIGNHKPVLKNIDKAMRRRFNIVPFTVTPERVDQQLPEKLRAEWPAILRWAINGCLDWQAHGLMRPQVVVEDTAAYFAEQDVFGHWLEDRCDVNQNAQWRTSATVLFMNWRDYAIASGEEAGSLKSFSTRLEQRHFHRYRTKQGRGFIGIRISAIGVTDDG